MNTLELDLAFRSRPLPGSEGIAAQPVCPLVDSEGAEERWGALLTGWLQELQAELPARLRAAAYSLGLELTDDTSIAALNETWRQRSGPTDVLAFAAQEEPPPAPSAGEAQRQGLPPEPCLELGDIVISLETAERQAQAAGHGLEEELLFLASHGLLHLLGWDHPDGDSLHAMLARQRALLGTSPC